MNSKSYATKISIIVALGGFALGHWILAISGAIPFLREDFQLSALMVGWVTSSLVVGCMAGFLTAGFLSDRFGRKKVLLATALLLSVGGICCAIAPSFIFLILGRVIGGIAIGWGLVIAPVYISEIAPAEKRGSMGMINQLAIMIGISAAYFLNWLVLDLVDVHQWRWMLGLVTVPSVLYFIFLFVVPESPRWFALKGEVDQASTILSNIGGEQYAAEQICSIQESTEKTQQSTSMLQLFKGKLFTILLIGIAIGSLQQLIGINAILYYAPDLFEKIGGSRSAAFVQACIIGIINIVFALVAMRLIDRIGRKSLLVIGIVGIIICHLVVAFSFMGAKYSINDESIAKLKTDVSAELMGKIEPLKDRLYSSKKVYLTDLASHLTENEFKDNKLNILKSTVKLNSTVILVAILSFVGMYAMSLGPVTWVLLSELYPTQFRAKAISIAGFFNGLSSFFIPLLFPWELENIGEAATFFIFASIALVGFFFILYKIPETKGKSLEEIEAALITKS
ncbi:MAG: sugar porter family MFS transporter [Planctomycetota bacterium]|nr:MAG: sugar porter family MFS transporter [Planctomycetota bacterium]